MDRQVRSLIVLGHESVNKQCLLCNNHRGHSIAKYQFSINLTARQRDGDAVSWWRIFLLCNTFSWDHELLNCGVVFDAREIICCKAEADSRKVIILLINTNSNMTYVVHYSSLVSTRSAYWTYYGQVNKRLPYLPCRKADKQEPIRYYHIDWYIQISLGGK